MSSATVLAKPTTREVFTCAAIRLTLSLSPSELAGNGFDYVHSKLFQLSRKLQLLLLVHGCAWGLLAVRSVVSKMRILSDMCSSERVNLSHGLFQPSHKRRRLNTDRADVLTSIVPSQADSFRILVQRGKPHVRARHFDQYASAIKWTSSVPWYHVSGALENYLSSCTLGTGAPYCCG